MTKNNKTAAAILTAVLIGIFAAGCGKKGPVSKVFPTATPTVIPHVEKIVYTYNGALYQCDQDGKSKEELFPDGRSKWFPSVSPDGWHIAYWVFSNGNYNLWAADMRKRRSVQITFDNEPIEGDIQNFMINNCASWNADATALVYSRNKDIWKISPEGYDLSAVTENRKSIAPCLSEQNILYFTVMENKTTQNIYFKQLGQDQEQKLTSYIMKKAVSISVAPDGKKLVYSLIDGDSVNIYKYDLEKKTDVPITTDGKSMSPHFTKDGSRIVFVSTISNRFQPDIWIMKADGTDRRRITMDGGVAPAWLYALTAEMPATYTPTTVVKNIEKQMIVPTKTPQPINEQKPITQTSDNEKEMENVTEMAADIKFESENEPEPISPKAQPASATPQAVKAAVKAASKPDTAAVKQAAPVKAAVVQGAAKPAAAKATASKTEAVKQPEASGPKPTFTPVKAVPYNTGGRSSSTSSW